MEAKDPKFDEWFVEAFGPRPDGDIWPRRTALWDDQRYGAWQAWLHLGLCHHEGKLPFATSATLPSNGGVTYPPPPVDDGLPAMPLVDQKLSRLPWEKHKEVAQALLAIYPTVRHLDRMVRQWLDTTLIMISSTEIPRPDVVDNIIDYCGCRCMLNKLINAINSNRKTHPSSSGGTDNHG